MLIGLKRLPDLQEYKHFLKFFMLTLSLRNHGRQKNEYVELKKAEKSWWFVCFFIFYMQLTNALLKSNSVVETFAFFAKDGNLSKPDPFLRLVLDI